MLHEQEATGGLELRSDATLANTAGKASRSCELDDLVSCFILELRVLSQELGLDADTLRHAASLSHLSAGRDDQPATAAGAVPVAEVVCAQNPITTPIDRAAELAMAVSEWERAQLAGHQHETHAGLNADHSGSEGAGTPSFQDAFPGAEPLGVTGGTVFKSEIPELLAELGSSDAPDIQVAAMADYRVVAVNAVMSPPSSPDPLNPGAAADPMSPPEVQPQKLAAVDSRDDLGEVDSALRNMVLSKRQKRRFLFLPW